MTAQIRFEVSAKFSQLRCLHFSIFHRSLIFVFGISGPPEITTAYLERYVAQEGDTVKLVCPIIGTPRPIIEWYQVFL